MYLDCEFKVNSFIDCQLQLTVWSERWSGKQGMETFESVRNLYDENFIELKVQRLHWPPRPEALVDLKKSFIAIQTSLQTVTLERDNRKLRICPNEKLE